MRRPTLDDLLPATFEMGCIVAAGSYGWVLAFWQLVPRPLRVLAWIGPGVLLALHLFFVFADMESADEHRFWRLGWRLAFTLALFLPLLVATYLTR